MHFNGAQWEEANGDKSNMPDGFFDIYGISKDNFWISSAHNVYEYNTGGWKKYFIGEDYIMQSIERIGNSVYITAYPVGVDTLYLMKFETDKFTIVDQTNLFNGGKFTHNGLLITNSKMYTFGWKGIYSANMNEEKVLVDSWRHVVNTSNGGFSNSFLLTGNDIWSVGTHSFPYHYNGSD